MKFRQRILSLFYPVLIKLGKLTSRQSSFIKNEEEKTPPVSLYDLSISLNDGKIFSLANAKGKKLLIVNTASNCGFTRQYEQLQALYEKNNDHLIVIGFPANDFKEQEQGDDATIADFCQRNFGVTFPLAKKSSVVKGENQNKIFNWLSDKKQNGWCSKPPSWNFSKYLVDEQGRLMYYFDPAVAPDDPKFLKVVHQ